MAGITACGPERDARLEWSMNRNEWFIVCSSQLQLQFPSGKGSADIHEPVMSGVGPIRHARSPHLRHFRRWRGCRRDQGSVEVSTTPRTTFTNRSRSSPTFQLGLWRPGVTIGADFCRLRDRADAFLVPRSRRRAGVQRAADQCRRFVPPRSETRRTLSGRSHLPWVLCGCGLSMLYAT